jgi:hypothetical protein
MVNVKLSLYLTKYHAIKTYWGLEVSSTHTLTSALDEGEWSVSRSGYFTSVKILIAAIQKEICELTNDLLAGL